MRLLFLYLILAGSWSGDSFAQDRITFDPNTPVELQVPILHQAWLTAKESAQRQALAGQLVDAVIHEYEKQEPEIVDEVARDGLPKNEIKSTATDEKITLAPLSLLHGVRFDPDNYPVSPIFRRISGNRFEAWTSAEGWLFDGKGKILADVKVPRRDGKGREWFGAFLPDGTWVTTDLWERDEQLNCFSAEGKWRWELSGSKMLSRLPALKHNPDSSNEPIVPSIGWARADRTGNRWLVCLGFNYNRQFAFIDANRRVIQVPEQGSLWIQAYPRSMGVRGMFTSLYINSDDGIESIHFNEAGHGVGVGWPNYDFCKQRSIVIAGGNSHFGFWPHSHDVFIEADGNSFLAAHRIWFFEAEGKYRGEIIGSMLGDAANGRDLLIQDGDDRVVTVTSNKELTVTKARVFTWPDGTTAVPLNLYDDLRVGFFLRGAGLQGTTDDSHLARRKAEVVLASW